VQLCARDRKQASKQAEVQNDSQTRTLEQVLLLLLHHRLRAREKRGGLSQNCGEIEEEVSEEEEEGEEIPQGM
jgi:hypothetical protein